GWMNQLHTYDPELFHPSLTHSVVATLDGATLKLSYPKSNIPRRATFEEEILNVAFVSHRCYDLTDAKVFLCPPSLARKRTWNKKYPICILLPDPAEVESRNSEEQDVEMQRDEGMKKALVPGQEVPGDGRERCLYLFGRTGREKEEWYQHLVRAARGTPGSSHRGPPRQQPRNALVGRIFWDFLREPYWAEQVSSKIQKKLSKIKLPYFMNELTLTELDMGASIPSVLSASNPTVHDRGLWVDMEVTYSGSLQMTLETKMNLCKLGKESASEESGPAEAGGEGRKILRFVDKIAKSKYFQKATENEFIKKKIEEVSNTPLLLTVEVQELAGTSKRRLAGPPTDRVWYSFRVPPQLELKVLPKLGEREVTFLHVTEWIEKKLQHEFQKILVMPNMDDLIIPIMRSGLDPQPPSGDQPRDLPAKGERRL
ncbi:PREDICTED: testis-expressed sequence 2 protein-like, partial [Mesitornis unicolor]|uniref:testis-expressed sequence 2 protein-like n=1 Tax=Mesitornis unicolor TaxID=54374 RepID=UPI0005288350